MSPSLRVVRLPALRRCWSGRSCALLGCQLNRRHGVYLERGLRRLPPSLNPHLAALMAQQASLGAMGYLPPMPPPYSPSLAAQAQVRSLGLSAAEGQLTRDRLQWVFTCAVWPGCKGV